MYHTCGLRTDGTATCWGRDQFGERTPPAATTFTRLAAGHSLLRTEERRDPGLLGSDAFGQSAPPSGAFIQVVAGWYHTCGLRVDRTLACWGRNDRGQGAPPRGAFTQVAAGGLHACGLRENGTLACWGDNTRGQSAPPAGTLTQITAGSWHSCGTRADGTFVCWGDHSDGAVAEVSFELQESSVAESRTPATIGVVLTAASTRTITVRYATASGGALGGQGLLREVRDPDLLPRADKTIDRRPDRQRHGGRGGRASWCGCRNRSMPHWGRQTRTSAGSRTTTRRARSGSAPPRTVRARPGRRSRSRRSGSAAPAAP